MPKITVRLSEEEYENLEKLAAQRGATISEVIRNMLYASKTLSDMRDELRGLLLKKIGESNYEEIAEIKRIVTLIGRAMPAVARSI